MAYSHVPCLQQKSRRSLMKWNSLKVLTTLPRHRFLIKRKEEPEVALSTRHDAGTVPAVHVPTSKSLLIPTPIYNSTKQSGIKQKNLNNIWSNYYLCVYLQYETRIF